MRRSGSSSDPLWYKDAVIYELHLKAFFDSTNDGIGDIPGLIQKLDYIESLGVTCLWLLPFFPSPLRDDGYDIADYLNIHPGYGSMEQFREFLAAAHERGLQVMIELVVNHTSDQHPWFEAARNAPPGSPEREFYVWSDTDQKYRDARIIFSDTEKSNWTWDPVAQAYYWHRFFSHQPDLNFDNPAVLEAVLGVMRYWLDLGVDGLRLDAIPYLVERDGTNCENLPETHAVIKAIRAAMDEQYANRVILAEANQWPADVRPYFGNGDECHMAFHFPLMPRLFMALRLEDRLPITDVMAQTPPIPDNCQWGLFLRNHDELTLEMVTDEERDYMYLAYSADPRMRINFGIRRRLAPLMDNNRRRMELLNSILFSFPGTPILYYGDEIGMGDNVYLGDRNGVRTPMQWSPDRNGGFSRANPAQLYSPLIMDAVYGYEAVNVEAQQSDPSSMLNWMRNMIALRKLFRVFGRGSLQFLDCANHKVLAYLRRWEGEQVLCVANLSRFAQPLELDLSELEGMVPVEMLGFVQFPPITRRPYPLTLAPYGFLWFELHPAPEPPPEVTADADRETALSGSWQEIFSGKGRQVLEIALAGYVARQRWFGGKSRQIESVSILDWGDSGSDSLAVAVIEVRYAAGAPERYFLPVGMSVGEGADAVRSNAAGTVICSVDRGLDTGLLHDATAAGSGSAALLAVIEEGTALRTSGGAIQGVPGSQLPSLRRPANVALPPVRSSAEQSNTSVIYGDRLILKVFRRLDAGPNPDCELSSYLAERTNFKAVPPFAGRIDYLADGQPPSTMAMLQGIVPNQGDAWTWTLEELNRYYERAASTDFPFSLPPVTSANALDTTGAFIRTQAKQQVGFYADSASLLGRRTAEMHLALASPSDDPAFAPEPVSPDYLKRIEADLTEHAAKALDTLKDSLARLPDDIIEHAGMVLSRRRHLTDSFRRVVEASPGGLCTRVHGDYHLGQVLRVKHDYAIIDFEGEPARSLEERRAKHSPLKDVAGMLRSFSYAAWAGLLNYVSRRPVDFAKLEPWARLWEQTVALEFLKAYAETSAGAAFLPSSVPGFRTLTEAFLVDKALYELQYEMNNRPDWVRIPLRGILTLWTQ